MARLSIGWQVAACCLRRHVLMVVCLIGACLVAAPLAADSIERVEVQRKGNLLHLEGRVLVEGQDGSLLLQTRDGMIWVLSAEEVQSRKALESPFEPLDAKALGDRLLEQLPAGFQVRTTDHYVIAFNTSEAYARWCSTLLERLYRAYFRFWEKRGLELHEPEFPLPVVIFDDQRGYAEFSRDELGEATSAVIGYYNFRTNHMVMFDLTGLAQASRTRRRRFSSTQIRQLLAQPGSERNVATIVHEATHQLAYNTGLQTRYAVTPFWLAEGLAIYFESPDLKNGTGWRTIGRVNRYRLREFQSNLRHRPANRLEQILTDDSLFRSSKTGGAAYADAWALTYYLIRKRPKDFVAYLREFSKLQPLENLSAEQRLRQFRKYFGSDLEELDRAVIRYMSRLR